NPGYRLKPGMYARVRLTVERRANALTVPRNAVVDFEGKRGVYMITEDIARFHPVTTGLSDGERIEIESGVTDGERVVTTGATALRDGDRVTLVGAQRGGAGRGGRNGGAPGRGR
ncbi:MAG TPA: hypothetical protein VFO19_01695, partial [Vicinamibacterales bacterium]|nr:hypothetical protein [Vicinamibacterales bacterium]